MLHCNDDVSCPGGASGHGVSNDPPDSEEAFLKATIGQQASGIEREGGEGDGGSGDGGSVQMSAIIGTTIILRKVLSQ